jgi:hypothetical protein
MTFFEVKPEVPRLLRHYDCDSDVSITRPQKQLQYRTLTTTII